MRFCIRPLNGTFWFLAMMDIRARSISFASRPRRPYGPPDHERAGERRVSMPGSCDQSDGVLLCHGHKTPQPVAVIVALHTTSW